MKAKKRKKRKLDYKKVQRQLTELERHLMEELQDKLSNVQNTSLDDPTELLDMVTQGEIDYMSAMSAESGSATIDEVHQALRKLREGTYGTCDACQRPIRKRRLKARPFAILCIGCKQQEERFGHAPSASVAQDRGEAGVTVSLTDEDFHGVESNMGDVLRDVQDVEISELF
ncbi:MAG: TraR/DksA family transcriptional regulator [Planctomycetota bacterium]|jgi:DnaK suppressor protein